MDFQITDRVHMKRNLKGIDTYGISPCVIKKHRNTVFRIRKVHEDDSGQYALRFYRLHPFTNGKKISDPWLAYWNPLMFEKVGGQ